MPNTSATGGPLTPVGAAPLEGQALLRFLQQWVVGVTGLPAPMVRPRWQAEPPDIPQTGVSWAAIGITLRVPETFAFIEHNPAGAGGLGTDIMRRNEEISLLCSFYDDGVNAQADIYAALLRDGAQIPQNLEPLRAQGMGLISTGDVTPLPSLLKERWLYRADVPVRIRREVVREYPVQNLVSAAVSGTVNLTVS